MIYPLLAEKLWEMLHQTWVEQSVDWLESL